MALDGTIVQVIHSDFTVELICDERPDGLLGALR